MYKGKQKGVKEPKREGKEPFEYTKKGKKGHKKTFSRTFFSNKLVQKIRDAIFQRVYVEKSLTDRLAKQELTKKKTEGNKNKVAFLAHHNDIHEAIKAGWAIKAIWEILSEEGKITFSYKTFRGYVSRLILEKNPPPQKPKVNPIKSKPLSAMSPTFTFQAKPNPEELL